MNDEGSPGHGLTTLTEHFYPLQQLNGSYSLESLVKRIVANMSVSKYFRNTAIAERRPHLSSLKYGEPLKRIVYNADRTETLKETETNSGTTSYRCYRPALDPASEDPSVFSKPHVSFGGWASGFQIQHRRWLVAEYDPDDHNKPLHDCEVYLRIRLLPTPGFFDTEREEFPVNVKFEHHVHEQSKNSVLWASTVFVIPGLDLNSPLKEVKFRLTVYIQSHVKNPETGLFCWGPDTAIRSFELENLAEVDFTQCRSITQYVVERGRLVDEAPFELQHLFQNATKHIKIVPEMLFVHGCVCARDIECMFCMGPSPRYSRIATELPREVFENVAAVPLYEPAFTDELLPADFNPHDPAPAYKAPLPELTDRIIVLQSVFGAKDARVALLRIELAGRISAEQAYTATVPVDQINTSIQQMFDLYVGSLYSAVFKFEQDLKTGEANISFAHEREDMKRLRSGLIKILRSGAQRGHGRRCVARLFWATIGMEKALKPASSLIIPEDTDRIIRIRAELQRHVKDGDACLDDISMLSGFMQTQLRIIDLPRRPAIGGFVHAYSRGISRDFTQGMADARKSILMLKQMMAGLPPESLECGILVEIRQDNRALLDKFRHASEISQGLYRKELVLQLNCAMLTIRANARLLIALMNGSPPPGVPRTFESSSQLDVDMSDAGDDPVDAMDLDDETDSVPLISTDSASFNNWLANIPSEMRSRLGQYINSIQQADPKKSLWGQLNTDLFPPTIPDYLGHDVHDGYGYHPLVLIPVPAWATEAHATTLRRALASLDRVLAQEAILVIPASSPGPICFLVPDWMALRLDFWRRRKSLSEDQFGQFAWRQQALRHSAPGEVGLTVYSDKVTAVEMQTHMEVTMRLMPQFWSFMNSDFVTSKIPGALLWVQPMWVGGLLGCEPRFCWDKLRVLEGVKSENIVLVERVKHGRLRYHVCGVLATFVERYREHIPAHLEYSLHHL